MEIGQELLIVAQEDFAFLGIKKGQATRIAYDGEYLKSGENGPSWSPGQLLSEVARGHWLVAPVPIKGDA